MSKVEVWELMGLRGGLSTKLGHAHATQVLSGHPSLLGFVQVCNMLQECSNADEVWHIFCRECRYLLVQRHPQRSCWEAPRLHHASI